jgi:F0F1-type ATP synthase assembly protein I
MAAMIPRRRWNSDTRRNMRDIGIYTAIPIMLGVGPAVGWYLGHLVRQQWGGSVWWEIGGTLFGLAAAIRQVYKAIKEGSKHD